MYGSRRDIYQRTGEVGMIQISKVRSIAHRGLDREPSALPCSHGYVPRSEQS